MSRNELYEDFHRCKKRRGSNNDIVCEYVDCDDVNEYNMYLPDDEFWHLDDLLSWDGITFPVARYLRFNTKLERLPWEIIFSIPSVKCLHIIENCLNVNMIPPSIGQLSDLIELKVTNCNAQYFPRQLGQLTNLTHLDLSSNRITWMLNEICNLTNLTYLDVSNNSIKDIPKNIGNLNKLTYFDFSNNCIEEIPKSFSNFNELTKLVLYDDCIRTIPSEIWTMSKLREVEYCYVLYDYVVDAIETYGNVIKFTKLTQYDWNITNEEFIDENDE